MTPTLLQTILWSTLSALVTLGVSYFVLGMKISNEMHFIRGQLVTLMAHFSAVQQVKSDLAVLDKGLEKAKTDLNHFYDRVKKLEANRANGSGHG